MTKKAYEMTVDSETEPLNNLYNTLYDYNRSLKYDSQFKRELERLVEYLEDELWTPITPTTRHCVNRSQIL